MTQRFEFEIDTERAISYWKQEVEENIAAGRVITSDSASESSDAARAAEAG